MSRGGGLFTIASARAWPQAHLAPCRLFEEFESLFGFPTSYTSRAMQPGEVNPKP